VDNLTHTLVGVALAQAGVSRMSRGAAAAVVLASNLPDIDVLFALQGSAAYLDHHRDLTHSVVGAPVLAILLAAALWLGVRGARFAGLALASLVGVAGHVFLDLWTSYGTRVLSPFDHTFYAWDLVFIADPLILVLLLLTVLVARRPAFGTRAASVGLGLVLSWVGARAVLHQKAIDEALLRVPSGAVRRVVALPAPLDPFRWRIVADTGAAYWTGTVTLGAATEPFRRRDKRPEDQLVVRVREESAVARVFLSCSTFPWLEVESTADGTAVTWRDLRFERRGRESFVARVLVGKDGRIRSQTFRF
jgi:inner membrane protein